MSTLFLNRSTFQALQHNLTAADVDHHVWRPDALGSIAFLVASALACAAVRRPTSSTPRGSLNARWANLGTFAGAICFLVGALLILPREPRRPQPGDRCATAAVTGRPPRGDQPDRFSRFA